MTAARQTADARLKLTDTAFISGLVLVWTSLTGFAITAGSAYIPDAMRNVLTGSIASPAMSFSANTWYHVYLYLNGATPALEVTTVAPAAAYWASAKVKSGDPSRRYIGSVFANAAGQLPKFFANENRFRWASFDATQQRMLGNGQATTPTAISTAAFAPVTATKLYVKLNNYLTGPANLLQLGPTSSDIQQLILQGSTGVATLQYADVDIPNGQVFYSYNTTPPTGGGGFIDSFGFEFGR